MSTSYPLLTFGGKQIELDERSCYLSLLEVKGDQNDPTITCVARDMTGEEVIAMALKMLQVGLYYADDAEASLCQIKETVADLVA